MKTPSFWYREKGIAARALAPLGLLYRAGGLARRAFASPYKATVPVICIGNIVAGGAGKTPTAIALAQLLQKEKKRVAFVSRGYGGSESGPLRVDPARHTAQEVGDEALLLALAAPTWIARRRADALREAEKEADIILLDDGLQNPSIAATRSLLVIDGGAGFGNGCLIPAGPLRETLADALPRLTAVIIIGEDRCGCAKEIHLTQSNERMAKMDHTLNLPPCGEGRFFLDLLVAPKLRLATPKLRSNEGGSCEGGQQVLRKIRKGVMFSNKLDNPPPKKSKGLLSQTQDFFSSPARGEVQTALPIINAKIKLFPPANLTGTEKFLAFAGIGRPQKFYDSCRAAGLAVAATQDFADHHDFCERDLAALSARADKEGLQLITTAKDFVRLPKDFRPRVKVLDITLEFEDRSALLALCLTPDTARH